MSQSQIQRLNSIGFVWNVLSMQWEEGFQNLEKYRRREGHCIVPSTFMQEDFKLGIWVATQRASRKRLDHSRIKRLNEIGFVWDPIDQQWEEGFSSLKGFIEREGHCLVSATHTERGFKLGGWVRSQRFRRKRLDDARIKRLNEIGFVWDPIDQRWEEGFLCLKAFLEREGHCLVPQKHTEDGFRLGTWVSVQRTNQTNLDECRVRRLSEIGFIWDPISQQWEQGFLFLEKFVQREGHCLVPQKYTTDGFNLGLWVSNQRARRGRISLSYRNRLDALGFKWSAK
jgi:hypothetical protein